MTHYNKLVRDRIPEILAAQNKKFITKTLNSEEYKKRLIDKLEEEIKEYKKEEDISELADIVEVISAICENEDMTWETFEQIRKTKREDTGGFYNRIILIEVKDDSTLQKEIVEEEIIEEKVIENEMIKEIVQKPDNEKKKSTKKVD